MKRRNPNFKVMMSFKFHDSLGYIDTKFFSVNKNFIHKYAKLLKV